MSRDAAAVDLSNCDREPIHKPGSIQNFGALIAVTNDWLVAHRSANLAAVLGLSKLPDVGTPLNSVFSQSALGTLHRATTVLVGPDDVERLFGVALVDDVRLFDIALHAVDELVILEIEPADSDSLDRQIRGLQPILRQLELSESLEELCSAATTQLKALLGFDRVMVYRFHSDGSGEVIAEAREDRHESFLGLRYPHTDIPRQARALYLRNRFRIISDVAADPVPIEPGVNLHGDALDLSLSTLRAVSPIHIEYLKNMGVSASLSISIIVGGRLWGLFACHHYSAKVLPYSLRTVAELFSELFSLMVERSVTRAQTQHQEIGRKLNDNLMRAIGEGHELVTSLPDLCPVVARALPHDGASVFIDGLYASHGSAPEEGEFRAILPMLNAAASSRVIATDALAERVPQAAGFCDRAAGALIIPISRNPRDFFVLWRRPLSQVVTWAGDPAKAVEAGAEGGRLSPRKSFEAWQQKVEGRSRDWGELDRQIAESLRITLLEIVLRQTDESNQERGKAQQHQNLLIAELNHRVRNILNLIRGLINQSQHSAQDVEDFVRLVGGRISALAIAHDNITRENWTPASLSELIRSEAAAYVGGQLDRVAITGEEILVSPEAYTVLALVLHELITNSVKYGALREQTGHLAIAISANQSGATIVWDETGGPPVSPPERRGFGSTIIEKSIPFELNGRACVEYLEDGLKAKFWIPGQFMTTTGSAIAGDHAAPEARVGQTGPHGTPTTILVVEDSMMIALDTQECLQSLGVGSVTIESTVAGALIALGRQAFDCALLDFNLGSETSERIAEALRQRGIPFWLATGYGEMEERLGEFGAKGLLVKPYGKEELSRLLRDFSTIDAAI